MQGVLSHAGGGSILIPDDWDECVLRGHINYYALTKFSDVN